MASPTYFSLYVREPLERMRTDRQYSLTRTAFFATLAVGISRASVLGLQFISQWTRGDMPELRYDVQHNPCQLVVVDAITMATLGMIGLSADLIERARAARMLTNATDMGLVIVCAGINATAFPGSIGRLFYENYCPQ